VPGSQKRWDVALRRDQVLKLDLAGYRDRQIAEKLGISMKTVQNDLYITRKELTDRVTGQAEARRAQSLARLEDALTVAVEVMRKEHLAHSNGRLVQVEDEVTGEVRQVLDDGPRLAAVDKVVKIVESIRNMFGDNAPSKVDNTVTGSVEYVVKVDAGEMEQL
jgi:DNA-binding CsgD family transcriptional regulator